MRLPARVWRLIYNMRSPKERTKRQDAEEEVISRAQLQAFPEEYMALLTVNEKISMSKLFP